MTTLSIKDVPESWSESLRLRAARNHRSLQGELMFLIEQAVHGAGATSTASTHIEQQAPWPGSIGLPRHGGSAVGLDRLGHPIMRQGWKSVEKIAAELKASAMHYPAPSAEQISSIDIIRQDRDSR